MKQSEWAEGVVDDFFLRPVAFSIFGNKKFTGYALVLCTCKTGLCVSVVDCVLCVPGQRGGWVEAHGVI